MTDDDAVTGEEMAQQLGGLEPLRDAPVPQMAAVGAIALNMAMKYHDINTVQDGALYDAYKRDGINMNPLHLDMVFETAIRIERHLMNTANRLSTLVYTNVIEAIADELGEDAEDEAPDAV